MEHLYDKDSQNHCKNAVADYSVIGLSDTGNQPVIYPSAHKRFFGFESMVKYRIKCILYIINYEQTVYC